MTTTNKVEETLGGAVVHHLPFPRVLDEAALAGLKQMSPLQVEQRYAITYLHSYGQDSPWFAALTNCVLLGSQDPATKYTYANPRGHDMISGQPTDWVVLPDQGVVHAFTVCHFGSEEFLPECPYVLALIEFEGVDTLFLTRLVGVDPAAASLDWIGMTVQARYLRNAKLRPTDVYFAPAVHECCAPRMHECLRPHMGAQSCHEAHTFVYSCCAAFMDGLRSLLHLDLSHHDVILAY